MVGKQKSKTKAQQRRLELLPEVGCICCKSYGYYNPWVQIHHVLSGSKRMGDDYTIGLCYWHHEDVPPEGLTKEQARDLVGPSLKQKKEFDKVFGGELELLEWTNLFLQQIEDNIV